METKWKHVLDLAREKGIIKARDIESLGVHPSYLTKLWKSGRLLRVGRGLYSLPAFERESLWRNMVVVSAYAPNCVICLLSALTYHSLGTQLPHAVWIAIPTHGAYPEITSAPIEVVQMAPHLLRLGTEIHVHGGIRMRITTPEKTVVDCFKYRHRVGMDVAIEALKEGLQDSRFTVDDLHGLAKEARVWRFMEPYVGALL